MFGSCRISTLLRVKAGLIGVLALTMQPLPAAQIESANIRIEFNPMLHSRIVAKFDGKEVPLGAFGPSEFVTTGSDTTIRDFAQTTQKLESVRDERGRGRRLLLTGTANGLQKTVVVTIYEANPRMAFFQVKYTNKSNASLRISGWTSHSYAIDAAGGAGEPAFWSFQSGSYRNRPDWVLPLKVGFKQENYLGMNAT